MDPKELIKRAAEIAAQHQENVKPEPEKDNNKQESVSTTVNTNDESGDKSIANTEGNQSNVGDNKKESETPKDNNEHNQKVDKSKFSDKEKMEYSFRKQYAKQEGKFRSQLEQLQKELQELKKGKEPKITRDNFESDEAYADWKLEQKAQELFEQQQNKLKEESNAIQMIERQKGEVVNKVKSLFETPDELKLYNDMVKFAMDNGFEDALKHDNGKDIKKFIDNSPIGPRVLQHLIGFPDKFNEIFNMDDSIDKKVELKLLEKELLHDIQMKKSKKPSNIDNKEMTNKEPVKPIGKLGVHGLGNGKQGDFSLDKIREIVKKHGR